MERLTKRADFLRAAVGERWATTAFVLQARTRENAPGAVARTGFTASRKVGNAVARNRARRRLKEAARAALEGLAREGHDYVLVARQGALTHPYRQILDDLGHAVHMVHARLDEPQSRRGGARSRRPAAPGTRRGGGRVNGRS